jgi:hypothetical protein
MTIGFGLRLRDAADFNLDVFLPVSGSRLAVFTAAEFLDEDLVALGFTDHFGRNRRAFDGGFTQFKAVIVGDGQHTVKGQIIARIGCAIIDLEDLTFFNFVLTSAVGNDRVHFGLNRFFLFQQKEDGRSVHSSVAF